VEIICQFKDIPGASEQIFLIVKYCYSSFKL